LPPSRETRDHQRHSQRLVRVPSLPSSLTRLSWSLAST
jgi:hypothetical protein